MQRFFRSLAYELWLFLRIASVGALMVIVALLLLTVFDSHEGQIKVLALIGTKVIFFGYPAYLLYRWLRRNMKKESRS